MVVDYSKWDKLELSDDSDIEVHPNVDKKSFIRWKQRDIHEKRDQLKFRILQLEVNVETNEDLLARVDKLVAAGERGRKLGLNVEADVKLAEEGEPKSKPAKATSPEQPKYADMLESMLLQIVAEGGNPATVLNKVKEHREMIANALRDERKELAQKEQERKEHITSDDIRTGWDSTIVYKAGAGAGAGAAEAQRDEAAPGATAGATPNATTGGTASASTGGTKSTAVQTVETINAPAARRQPKANEDGLEELLPETEAFGRLPVGDMEAAYKYLMRHPYIVTEGQKDALTMSAFEHEFGGDVQRARQAVWNALLIQYSATLGKNGVQLFFSKIVKKDHPAREAFEQDYATTYTHIHNRCEILRKEHVKSLQEDDAEETIQLHPVDANTELVIQVPSADSAGFPIYDALPADLKAAIDTRKLAEINTFLGALSVADAEDVVAKLSESGVLQVENKVYEVNEWEQKKAELEQGSAAGQAGQAAAAPAAAPPAGGPATQDVASSLDELD